MSAVDLAGSASGSGSRPGTGPDKGPGPSPGTAPSGRAASRAPASGPAASARPVRRFSTRLLRSELRLVFGRRRNQAGMAVLAAVPVIIAVAIKIADPSPQGGGGGPDFFNSITSNGLFVALASLAAELTLFLPLAVAAVSSDTIAGEANAGTLRYLLTVPVHRTRALAVKYAAVVIFTAVAVLLVATVGVLIGVALFSGGPVTLLSGAQVPLGEGLLRLLAICGYIAAVLCALAAIGMFVSTLTEQPIGGTIAVVMLTITSEILTAISQLDWLHPYLLTYWWTSFGDLLRDPVATHDIQRGLLSALAYTVIFCTAAWARFNTRDITS